MTNAEWSRKKNICHLSFVIHYFILTAIIFFSFSVTSCIRENNKNDGILIAVSIPPQAWFVSQIAGNNAAHLILVPPGQNPHNYEPTPKQIQMLASADAWILSGSEFEISLRPKIEKLFPSLLIIDGAYGVDFRFLSEHEHHDCDDHDHNSSLVIDRHTWLGKKPAIILASHIKDALCFLDNQSETFYVNKYDELLNEIDNVFDELRIALAPLNGKNIFVYHPSFGYFFDEFGIVQEAVETGGKEPTPRQLNNLMQKIIEEKPAAIFVQAQFPVNAAKTLADAAASNVIQLDPLAQDWLGNIRHMGQMLKNIIQ